MNEEKKRRRKKWCTDRITSKQWFENWLLVSHFLLFASHLHDGGRVCVVCFFFVHKLIHDCRYVLHAKFFWIITCSLPSIYEVYQFQVRIRWLSFVCLRCCSLCRAAYIRICAMSFRWLYRSNRSFCRRNKNDQFNSIIMRLGMAFQLVDFVVIRDVRISILIKIEANLFASRFWNWSLFPK